jgi:glucokinase
MPPLCLAADVGGTKTDAALFRVRGGILDLVRKKRFLSRSYPSIEKLLAEFLREGGETAALASLGVAGVVEEGRAISSNLPWSVDGEAVARALGLARVALLNDVAAAALGLGELEPSGFLPLRGVRPDPSGARALIAAGTGLGEAILPPAPPGKRRAPVLASEGGHADYAPGTPLEADLWRELWAEHGHVSWERVVSGPGLARIHRFLVESGRAPLPERVAKRFTGLDPAAVIAEEGVARTDEGCRAALALFCRAYGAEAGNLALKALATGGLYVGGGIAPKILPKLREGEFLEGFLSKGRLRQTLERIPVFVVLDPDTALLGAARHGADILRGTL